ncbi:hypothetical protein DICVIV_04948 [Dictyocaulus viviparus]|uniref:Uncharacterized protein n=1 Tax=Dictyocaulus viviparus TaxID=29172 RepID=A0A0D8XYT5_DICVI|nr:hypothetical protein DICVIV_04948 [Dictyocaulus viviparus]
MSHNKQTVCRKMLGYPIEISKVCRKMLGYPIEFLKEFKCDSNDGFLSYHVESLLVLVWGEVLYHMRLSVIMICLRRLLYYKHVAVNAEKKTLESSLE